jgi:glycerol-3-phosphate responsive antiterminator
MGCPASDMNSTPTAARRPTTNEQVVEFHIVDFMIPLLRLEQQDKSRVLVDVDFLNGVHHDPDF